jgi:LuxR family transcriptional regulator, regulator of acetate metabolism
MRSGSPLLRPRDADALRAELRHVAEESGMPLTFGGEVHDDYDGPVLQEGIKSILAVPVVVEGRPRAGRPPRRSVKCTRSCAG